MKSDWMLLGNNCRFSMDSSVTGLNNNVVVCGGSGSGKTMSVTEPRLLETKNQSLIVTVTKRRIVEKYMDVFKQRGYEVLDLNLSEPEKSTIAFDPLAGLTEESDIHHLAKCIVQENDERIGKDPFWNNAAISLLCAEIGYLRFKNPKATLAEVLDFNDKLMLIPAPRNSDSYYTPLDEDFEWLEKEAPKHYAALCWKSFRVLPQTTAGSVSGILNTALSSMFTTKVRDMMARGEAVDIERLASVKTVLFITSSAVNPALHRFVNVFYSRAFARLFEFAEKQPDGKLPIPVQVICDDFATGSRVADFPEYISIFREKQLSVMLLIQSESQLKNMYGDRNATTIIDNCDTYLYMGGMDLETANAVNCRIDSSIEEVLEMPIGQMYVFRRGCHPQLTTRYDILQDERYRKITAHYEEMVQRKLAEEEKHRKPKL